MRYVDVFMLIVMYLKKTPDHRAQYNIVDGVGMSNVNRLGQT